MPRMVDDVLLLARQNHPGRQPPGHEPACRPRRHRARPSAPQHRGRHRHGHELSLRRTGPRQSGSPRPGRTQPARQRTPSRHADRHTHGPSTRPSRPTPRRRRPQRHRPSRPATHLRWPLGLSPSGSYSETRSAPFVFRMPSMARPLREHAPTALRPAGNSPQRTAPGTGCYRLCARRIDSHSS